MADSQGGKGAKPGAGSLGLDGEQLAVARLVVVTVLAAAGVVNGRQLDKADRAVLKAAAEDFLAWANSAEVRNG